MRNLKCNLGFKNPNTVDNPIFDNRKYRDAQCNLPLFYQQPHMTHPHIDPTIKRERDPRQRESSQSHTMHDDVQRQIGDQPDQIKSCRSQIKANRASSVSNRNFVEVAEVGTRERRFVGVRKGLAKLRRS